uniref:Ig-like domain-containing protein n=1 Tax=Monopterus albus TaxID=43700 RepID=A0A3Q3JIH3_MONAL
MAYALLFVFVVMLSLRRSGNSFGWFLTYILYSTDLHNITAAPGDEVTLPCHVIINKFLAPLVAVWWIGPSGSAWVFSFQNGRLEPRAPGFQDRRVEFIDSKTENMRNASLVLKNVAQDDSGTYKCYRVREDSNERLLDSTIHLSVDASRRESGSGRPVASMAMIVLLLLLVERARRYNVSVSAIMRKRNGATHQRNSARATRIQRGASASPAYRGPRVSRMDGAVRSQNIRRAQRPERIRCNSVKIIRTNPGPGTVDICSCGV